MKRHFSSGNWIAIMAAGFMGLFLVVLVLSAVPTLHERIHSSRGANHECAITLLASGNCQHTPVEVIAIARPASPIPFGHAIYSFQLVTAHLEFSLLEHAPPAIS